MPDVTTEPATNTPWGQDYPLDRSLMFDPDDLQAFIADARERTLAAIRADGYAVPDTITAVVMDTDPDSPTVTVRFEAFVVPREEATA